MNITKAWRVMLAKARAWTYTFNVNGNGYPGRTGGGSHAGMYVDRDVALQSATVAACANLIGLTIATLGFDVMRKRKGSAVIVTDHSLYEVLRWEPNRQQTAHEFIQRHFFDVELSGNGYARIVRSMGDVVALQSWIPESVEIDTKTRPEWTYRYQNGAERESLPERGAGELHNVLHHRNITTDGVKGISTVELARQRIALELVVEKYGATFFGKGGRVKDIFEYAGTLKEEQRASFKSLFRENYGNDDSFHEAMLLEAGVKLGGKSGSTPNEAQFIETQTNTAIAICRFFGVPPTLVGILDRATYNNQEQLMLQFLQLCIATRVERAEQSFRRALLSPAEKRQGFYIHSKVQKLLRADSKARSEFYKTLQSTGVLSQNDVREFEDMPRIDDPKADEYRQAVNIFGPDEAAAAAGAEAGTTAGAEAGAAEARRAAA